MHRLVRITRPGRLVTLGAAGLLSLGLAGCGSSVSNASAPGGSSETTAHTSGSSSTASKSNYPTFVIDAEMPYKFTLPESTAPSGYVQVELVNKDTEMAHQAQLVKLNDGVSFTEFKSDLTGPAGDAAMATDGVPAGGPNSIGPGHSDTAIVDLTPGATYAVVCNIPAPDGKPHYLHGMVSSFNVEKSAGVTEAPDAASTIKLVDFAYEVPANVNWSKPIAVTNQGQQPHEMAILGPMPDKTLADVKTALMAPPGTGPAGPPPYLAYGGVSAIAPGATQVFQPDLPKGKYYLVCFVPDSAPPHLPHLLKGMISEIDVS